MKLNVKKERMLCNLARGETSLRIGMLPALSRLRRDPADLKNSLKLLKLTAMVYDESSVSSWPDMCSIVCATGKP